MLDRISCYIESKPKQLITLLGLLCVSLTGMVDYLVRWELHLSYIYIFPIMLVSWFVNKRTGILVATCCAWIWFISGRLDGVKHSSGIIAVWNSSLPAGVLIAFACVVARLRSKFDRISDVANKDFLTGLPNARAFYELAGYEMKKAFGLEPLALAYIDLEGFKWINQRFGYATGDQMLCSIAQTILQGVVRKDLVGRIGGTAFAVLMPNTSSDGAHFILEKIHDELKNERRRYAQPVNVFISAIACTKAPRSVAQLMHQAETSMTRMKGNDGDALEILRVDSVPPLN
jgi:diguanylate cyclase (GGDEF)-like protein